jgi:DNA-binding transcriptional MerR regulator
MSIGEVLSQLRPDFPDVTISKIRFLESEGLVEPERSPSGYRKFSAADVQRLRYVLAAQRDHYLPLRVIKEHLDAMDRGLEPPVGPGAAPRLPGDFALPGPETPGPETFAPDTEQVRLSRTELVPAAGVDDGWLDQLEAFGLVAPCAEGGRYDANALLVARTVAEMGAYGLEPRHLRSFKAAADREVGLIEQVIAPLLGQRSPDARSRADETTEQLAALSVQLHAALVRAGLTRS